MTTDVTNSDQCQVDFYLLGDRSLVAGDFACRLAMMAWERKQKVFLTAVSDSVADQLDELMWHKPKGRFLPHARSGQLNADKAAVNIGTISSLNPADVVINLCPEAIPHPTRFGRVLEIVPYAEDEREASRVKYKTYRNLGLDPRTHEISK